MYISRILFAIILTTNKRTVLFKLIVNFKRFLELKKPLGSLMKSLKKYQKKLIPTRKLNCRLTCLRRMLGKTVFLPTLQMYLFNISERENRQLSKRNSRFNTRKSKKQISFY